MSLEHDGFYEASIVNGKNSAMGRTPARALVFVLRDLADTLALVKK